MDFKFKYLIVDSNGLWLSKIEKQIPKKLAPARFSVVFSTQISDAMVFDILEDAVEAKSKAEKQTGDVIAIREILEPVFSKMLIDNMREQITNTELWLKPVRKILHSIPDCKHGMTCMDCKLKWVEKMKKQNEP